MGPPGGVNEKSKLANGDGSGGGNTGGAGGMGTRGLARESCEP
jgi:hypothetical protein